MSNHAGEWLTLDEAGSELKVPAQVVEGLVSSGALAAARVGPELRIPVSSLRRYAARAERTALARRYGGARTLIGACAAALFLVGAVVIAAGEPGAGEIVPRQIPYRGSLDHNGVPVTNASTQMRFELFQGETAATASWSETQTVSVEDGFFSVALGDNQPIPAALFEQPRLFLGITVDGQPLSGRQRLLTVPYAHQAASATSSRRADSAGQVDSVPRGAVMFFDMPGCPSGWEVLPEARGRALVGLPINGAVRGNVGTPMFNREVRTHQHGMQHAHHLDFYSHRGRASPTGWARTAAATREPATSSPTLGTRRSTGRTTITALRETPGTARGCGPTPPTRRCPTSSSWSA